MAFYRASTANDCIKLAPKMRVADEREVMAAGRLTPLSALQMSFNNSAESNTIIHDDEVVGMFGIGECVSTGFGVPWLLASDRITDIKIPFLRQSKQWVKIQAQNYKLLYNYVAAENTVAVNWLRFLGFKFLRELEDFQGGGLTFYEFVRIEDV